MVSRVKSNGERRLRLLLSAATLLAAAMVACFALIVPTLSFADPDDSDGLAGDVSDIPTSAQALNPTEATDSAGSDSAVTPAPSRGFRSAGGGY